MRHYERLLAWRECHKLVLNVYRATQSLPKFELYGVTSQTRRAALSAAVNIVEGSAKKGPAEFRRFLDISLRPPRPSPSLVSVHQLPQHPPRNHDPLDPARAF